MKEMHVYPQKLQIVNGLAKMSCVIERLNDSGVMSSDVLYYEFDELEKYPAENDTEGYLIALIMQAMSEGRSLKVHGAVSDTLLSNLTEFRDAWCLWKPKIFYPIDFYSEEVYDQNPYKNNNGAVCAFSGGLDSTFSVWRHVNKLNFHRSQDIKFCTFVKGFDIKLDNEVEFTSARNIASASLHSVGLPLVTIATNFRQIVTVHWEYSHAAALVSTLHPYKALVNTCIVGSTDPYDSLIIPWGSSPITDHLLTSKSFTVLHDGASCSRGRKIFEIRKWEIGSKNLRFCWQGKHKDKNCGKCGKCLRMAFNFLANKLEVPANIPVHNYENSLKKIKFANSAEASRWHEILNLASYNNIKEKWVRILYNKLFLYKVKNFIKYIIKYKILPTKK